jgi:hypothetical protein
MPMSKKDYVTIAATLNGVRRDLLTTNPDPRHETPENLAIAVVDEITEHLADRFAEASDTFNPDTFRAAVRKED